VLRIVIIALALAAIVPTLLSVLHSYRWWIRVWDFPRLAVLLLALVALAAVLIWLQGGARIGLALLLVAAIGWQAWRIAPYTPLATKEVRMTAPEADHCVRTLSLNVLQTNRDYARTLQLIDREDPDILLLLETDKDWQTALAPVIARYPHRFLAPLDNLYGLIMLSRLPTEQGAIAYLIEEGTPSVFARMETQGGRAFQFIGLHPRPPQPGKDTEERDAEIAVAARIAAKADLPVLAMGDFNDVAWSRTSQMFKRIGGYLDPRIGRGLYATFPASLPLLRWPLDHLFISPDFTVGRLAVLENVGSDHRPVAATLCLAPRIARTINSPPEPPDAADHETAQAAIRDGLQMAREHAGQDLH